MKPYNERLPLIDAAIDKLIRITKDTVESYKQKESTMSDDWYEKGELPPVGEECNAKIYPHALDKFEQAKVVYRSSKNVVVVEYKSGDIGFLTAPADFRPLRTETDRLVDEALETLKSDYATHLSISDLDLKMCAETIIEAGYRKVKPMSEDEFIDASELDHDTGLLLYRAGCRFLDQGE